VSVVVKPTPLFIATERFDSSDAARWEAYCKFAKIPALKEVVSLDALLCERLVKEIEDEDWPHIVNENVSLGYFYNIEYLLKRVAQVKRRNVLGLYRNPREHVSTAPAANFVFVGYDLIEEITQISALTNCGGFPDVFSNRELNHYGLLQDFSRTHEVKQQLAKKHPKEPHAQCELYAVWRLNE